MSDSSYSYLSDLKRWSRIRESVSAQSIMSKKSETTLKEKNVRFPIDVSTLN